MAKKRKDALTDSYLEGERRSEPVPEREIDEARRAELLAILQRHEVDLGPSGAQRFGGPDWSARDNSVPGAAAPSAYAGAERRIFLDPAYTGPERRLLTL